MLLLLYLNVSDAEDQWKEDLEHKRSLLITFLCFKEPKSRFCDGKSNFAITDGTKKEQENPPQPSAEQLPDKNSRQAFKEILPAPGAEMPEFWSPMTAPTTPSTPKRVTSNNNDGFVSDHRSRQTMPKKIPTPRKLPDEIELLTAASLDDPHGAKLSHTGGLKSYDPNALWRNDVDSINYGRTDLDEIRPPRYYQNRRPNLNSGPFNTGIPGNGGLFGPLGLGNGGLVGVTNGVGVSLPLGLGGIGITGGVGIGRR
uniref:PI31_Prot_C domain-containing protein n=1 Tax=Syphacia muris TaxID=451379 RepID=A0A0N5AZU2_9BILA